MEHCHMPLQAGHDDLLRRMRRVYTVESYAAILENLRAAVPDIGLTTDIIVGFPGETDEEFEGTLAAVRRFQFDGAFMFKYSPRPNTPGALMEQVDDKVASARLEELIRVQTEIQIARNEAQVGRTMEVMVEGPSPKNKALLQGYSRDFRMVHFPAREVEPGALVAIRATAAHKWGLMGEWE
jgi:tRNA-2-methylthio-N6-dimethylallyladenosine synthase